MAKSFLSSATIGFSLAAGGLLYIAVSEAISPSQTFEDMRMRLAIGAGLAGAGLFLEASRGK